jgi:hypothetical protein
MARSFWRSASRVIGISCMAAAFAANAAGEGVLPYPRVVDPAHASKDAIEIFNGFFTAKSNRDAAQLNAYFSRAQMVYIDATLGLAFPTYDAVSKGFADLMPHWPASGRSYPTRIIGDTRSALVAFTDTPELFGGDMRLIAAVDFKDGKIIRWVDYWDGRNFGTATADKLRVPADQYPADLGEKTTGDNASPAMQAAAKKLGNLLLKGDADAVADLFAYDGVFEDMTLHSQLQGVPALKKFLSRAITKLPYGAGASAPVHIVGSNQGGGYEWRPAESFGPALKGGIVALELDHAGRISRFTTVWDGSTISNAKMSELMQLLIEN